MTANHARRRSSCLRESSQLYDAVILVLCTFVLLITLYPIYYVFIMALSGGQHAIAMDVYFWPKDFSLDNLKLLATDAEMWNAYRNTLLYVVGSTVLTLITSATCAYPLSVKGLPGRKFVVAYLLVPMYFGGGLIPSYLLITQLGLYDTPWAIILPASFNVMNIILVRTSFTQLPESLRESAKIDGANHFTILARIYLPLSKPILAVVAIYSVVGMWNSWFNAQVYLPNREYHPLQLYLQRVLVQQTVDLTQLRSEEYEWAMEKMFTATQLKYSMIVFTVLPVLFTYPFFQRYFVKGIMVGSLKE